MDATISHQDDRVPVHRVWSKVFKPEALRGESCLPQRPHNQVGAARRRRRMIIECLYEGCKTGIMQNAGKKTETNETKIEIGLHQGLTSIPLPFVIIMNVIQKRRSKNCHPGNVIRE